MSWSASRLYCWQGAQRSAVANAITVRVVPAATIASSSGGAFASSGGSATVSFATMKPVAGS